MAAETAPATKPKKHRLAVALPVAAALLVALFIAVQFVPPGFTIRRVRNAATRERIAKVQAGLEAYKKDFRDYPPGDPVVIGSVRYYAYQMLPDYLMGPPKGFGRGPTGHLPPASDSTTRTYGPYYSEDEDGTAFAKKPEDASGPSSVWKPRAEPIWDPFPSPRRPILYFRFDHRDASYHAHDNPVDPTCQKGFASQEHFELTARYRTPDGVVRWHRKDYLLISAGADRLYGWVTEDEETGDLRPAATRQEVETGKAWCDDMTNFR